MHHSALRVIRDEHASLAAMLQSMLQMIKRGPDADGKHAPEQYFDVLRAMLFYVDEFPEQRHHRKESRLHRNQEAVYFIDVPLGMFNKFDSVSALNVTNPSESTTLLSDKGH